MILDEGAPRGGGVLEHIYERHRERIQEAAARKHGKRQTEKDGTIIVHPTDLSTREFEPVVGVIPDGAAGRASVRDLLPNLAQQFRVIASRNDQMFSAGMTKEPGPPITRSR